jgi:hypothetical protein
MENLGWGFSPTLETGPVFTCIVTGDPRLPEAAYPFVRDTLDQLPAAHLPAVRIAYVSRTAGAITWRGCARREMDIYFVADRGPEILDMVSAKAVVVFDGGGKESDSLVHTARERRIALRVVDLRAFVTPARL